MTRVGMEDTGTGHGWGSCPSLQPFPLATLPLPPAPPTESPALPPPGLRLPTLLEGATVLQCGWGAHWLRVHAQVCGHVEEVSGRMWQEVGVVTSSEWV